MDFVIGLVGHAVMELLMYNIGRATIFLISFGRVRTQRVRELVSNRVASPGMDEGRIVIPAGIAQLIGVAMFSLFWVVFFALRR